MWNLVSNAIKFSAEGSSVEVQSSLADGRVQVSVRDQGEGIDAAFLSSVFERFRQADPSPSRRHGGLGLGLSIVKQLVELQGGIVEARSDGPGTGATFTIQLPVPVDARLARDQEPLVPNPN